MRVGGTGAKHLLRYDCWSAKHYEAEHFNCSITGLGLDVHLVGDCDHAYWMCEHVKIRRAVHWA